MSIINFDNPQLLVGAQWYPPPQGAPADIRSFTREQAYICCIGKTHAVFRYTTYPVSVSAHFGEHLVDVVGVDLLFEHPLSDAVEKIKTTIVDSLYHTMQLPRELCELVVQYHHDCTALLLQLLYSIVIQQGQIQRKIHCAAARLCAFDSMYAGLSQREIEDEYEENGVVMLDISRYRQMSENMQDLMTANQNLTQIFKINITQWRKLLSNPLSASMDNLLKIEGDWRITKQEEQLGANTPYALCSSVHPPYSLGQSFSRYIRIDHQANLPQPDLEIQPLIEQYKQSFDAVDRPIPPVVLPGPYRSCLQIIGDFFQALWEMISDCFRNLCN